MSLLGKRKGPALLTVAVVAMSASMAWPSDATMWMIQAGGGLVVLPAVAVLLGLAGPALMVEVGLVRDTGRTLPMALRQVSGGFGEVVGWLALFHGVLLAAWCSAVTGGWLLGAMAQVTGRGQMLPQVLTSTSATAAPLVVWLSAALLARRGPRAIALALKLAAAVAVTAGIAVFLSLLLDSGTNVWMTTLLDPRPRAMLEPRFWAYAAGWACTGVAAGAGVVGSMQWRAGPAAGWLVMGLGAAGLLLLATTMTGMGLLATSGSLPPAHLGTTGLLLEGHPALQRPSIAQLVVAVLGGVGVATVLAALVIRGGARAMHDKWPSLPPRASALPALVGIAIAVLLTSAVPLDETEGPFVTVGTLATHLLAPWLFVVGLPAVSALLCLAARPATAALCTSLDPHNHHGLRGWLPAMVRWVAPGIGLCLLVLVVASQLDGLFGHELELRGLGAFADVAHTLAFLFWALSAFVVSTTLAWTAPNTARARG